MYKLNCQITEEASQILKDEAKRYGCSMGAVITRWALQSKKEQDVLSLPLADMLAEVMKAGQAQE